jgi:hypothetical protein
MTAPVPWALPTIVDGWYPRVSPDACKVAFGNVDLGVLLLEGGRARWPIGPGRMLRWLTNEIVTWTKPLDDRKALRFSADLRMFDGGRPTRDDPELVGANEFEANGLGQWAAWREADRRLVYDGRILEAGGTRGVKMGGRYLLTVIEDRLFRLYHDGVPVREYPLPPTANAWEVSPEGWISYGYWGEARAIDPLGVDRDLTVSPWRREGVPRIVAARGEPWAWTASERPDTGAVLVIGRPVGSATVIRLEGFAAASLDVAYAPVEDAFLVVGAGTRGELAAWRVPRTAPRQAFPAWPEPGGGAGGGGAGGEEGDVHKIPRVSIDKWDPVLRASGSWEVVASDPDNPGHGVRVWMERGDLYVELRNPAGAGRTGLRRHVVITP